MGYDTLLVEQKNQIGYVTLNRPAAFKEKRKPHFKGR